MEDKPRSNGAAALPADDSDISQRAATSSSLPTVQPPATAAQPSPLAAAAAARAAYLLPCRPRSPSTMDATCCFVSSNDTPCGGGWAVTAPWSGGWSTATQQRGWQGQQLCLPPAHQRTARASVERLDATAAGPPCQSQSRLAAASPHPGPARRRAGSQDGRVGEGQAGGEHSVAAYCNKHG